MFFNNKFIKFKTSQSELVFGIIAIEDIFIHSVMDGIIYSVTFSIRTFTGILTGIGLVVHEFAEGVITFSVLLKSGFSAKKAILYAFFVARVLIYVSTSHLLPEASEYEKKAFKHCFSSGNFFSFIYYAY